MFELCSKPLPAMIQPFLNVVNEFLASRSLKTMIEGDGAFL